MRLLLDTYVILWILSDSRVLSTVATRAIEDASEVTVSAVSFAEIGIKAATGKLAVPDDFRARVVAAGVGLLPLTADHGLAVAKLPLPHRDPVDRLLIIQARVEQLTVITADRRLHDYGVAVIYAD